MIWVLIVSSLVCSAGQCSIVVSTEKFNTQNACVQIGTYLKTKNTPVAGEKNMRKIGYSCVEVNDN